MVTKKTYKKNHLYRFLSSNQDGINHEDRGIDIIVLCTEDKDITIKSSNDSYNTIEWKGCAFSGTCILSNIEYNPVGSHINSWAGNMNWEDLGKI